MNTLHYLISLSRVRKYSVICGLAMLSILAMTLMVNASDKDLCSSVVVTEDASGDRLWKQQEMESVEFRKEVDQVSLSGEFAIMQTITDGENRLLLLLNNADIPNVVNLVMHINLVGCKGAAAAKPGEYFANQEFDGFAYRLTFSHAAGETPAPFLLSPLENLPGIEESAVVLELLPNPDYSPEEFSALWPALFDVDTKEIDISIGKPGQPWRCVAIDTQASLEILTCFGQLAGVSTKDQQFLEALRKFELRSKQADR